MPLPSTPFSLPRQDLGMPPSPTQFNAFATGTVAMVLAPSWEVAEVQAINPNPNLALPQPPRFPLPMWPGPPIGWNLSQSSSKNQAAAWTLSNILSSESELQKNVRRCKSNSYNR